MGWKSGRNWVIPLTKFMTQILLHLINMNFSPQSVEGEGTGSIIIIFLLQGQ